MAILDPQITNISALGAHMLIEDAPSTLGREEQSLATFVA
jgi:hypothetical protein